MTCRVCEGKRRVELVTDVPGRSMWMDCPACRPVPSWATIAELKLCLAKMLRLADVETQREARRLVTLTKCDGDHAQVIPCADPECWLL